MAMGGLVADRRTPKDLPSLSVVREMIAQQEHCQSAAISRFLIALIFSAWPGAVEQREKFRYPIHRIMGVEEACNSVVIKTTDVDLPDVIGVGLHYPETYSK
jgi:hypothetical protein